MRGAAVDEHGVAGVVKRSSALKRRTPLRARTTSRRSRKRSAYARRPRDTTWMLAVKQLPCMWRDLSPCEGPVEADHAGRRGLGRKAHDRTCVPACMDHHRQRTDHAGPFRALSRETIRIKLDAAIAQTQQQLGHVELAEAA